MKQILFFILLFIIASCSSPVNYVSNEDIDSEIVKNLMDIELGIFSNPKNEQVKNLFSPHLIEGNDNLDELLYKIRTMMSENETTVLDQYYIQDAGNKKSTTLISTGSSKKGYSLKVSPLNQEAFVSLRKIESEPYQILLTTQYSKYNDAWKLDKINFKKYAADHLNSEDLFQMARKSYEEGNILLAANEIQLSSKIYKPGGQFFHYKEVKEMQKLFKKIMNDSKVKVQFPFVLENVSGNPKILKVAPYVTDGGIFTSIPYLTKISLVDSAGIQTENEKIHSELIALFGQLNSDKSSIMYSAFNELPDGKKAIDKFTIIKD